MNYYKICAETASNSIKPHKTMIIARDKQLNKQICL